MNEFRVMSFNVNGQARFGWEERAVASGEVVKWCAAHIIGFQEFGLTNWDTFGPLLPHFDIYKGNVAGDIFINPIGWDKERFKIRAHGTQWLSQTPEIYSKGWDGSERGMSWCTLEDRETERHILFINVHLDNIGEIARTEGTRQVLDFINRHPYDLPVIITGDFNCSPYVPSENAPYSKRPYEMLVESGFTDTWVASNPEDASTPFTFHGYMGEEYVADQYATWHTDWIMSKNLNVLRHEIIHRTHESKYPSDHFPVIALFEYP
jgi:endonuclease/exonuclease/phosphatase family metal-dependent hydrolase